MCEQYTYSVKWRIASPFESRIRRRDSSAWLGPQHQTREEPRSNEDEASCAASASEVLHDRCQLGGVSGRVEVVVGCRGWCSHSYVTLLIDLHSFAAEAMLYHQWRDYHELPWSFSYRSTPAMLRPRAVLEATLSPDDSNPADSAITRARRRWWSALPLCAFLLRGAVRRACRSCVGTSLRFPVRGRVRSDQPSAPDSVTSAFR